MLRRLVCRLFHWPFWRRVATREFNRGYSCSDTWECPRCGDRWCERRWGF